MNLRANTSPKFEPRETAPPQRLSPATRLGGLLLGLCLLQQASGSENVPQVPFARWVQVPDAGQFTVGLTYAQSSSYHMSVGNKIYDITWKSLDGEYYGIDINQGFFMFQYGITKKWAADFEIGYTSEGWRFFDNGTIQSTSGLMDYSAGVRYQIFNEAEAQSPWVPSLTFRAGAVMAGTYDQNFIFAPGNRSLALVPELLARKEFGWPGLGAYFDGLFRWNETIGNSQYEIAVGVFQKIKGWELDLGYKRLQTLSGGDITFLGYNNYPATNGGFNIIYPRDPREVYDAIEAGFSYTTSKRQWKYGFHLLSVLDGNNTDMKLWLGAWMEVPIGGRKEH